MAGGYCKYCGFRCFVYRIVPDGPRKGWGGHMATCAQGMALDLKVLGHTHVTAVNPVTEPDLAEEIGAWLAGEQGRKATALAVDAGQLTEFAGWVNTIYVTFAREIDETFAGPVPAVSRMTDANWLTVSRLVHSRPEAFRLVRSYWNQAVEQLRRG
jgi:hypothetical protein